MATFGQLLRQYRQQCRDPLRGGLLTQDRLGELLGEELGDAGYTGAAVSEWERDRSKINADNRLVLVGLVTVLHKYGGLPSADAADDLLHSGNYRALDEVEFAQVFPASNDDYGGGQRTAGPFSIAQPRDVSSRQQASDKRRKQLILLDKVCNFWVNGVLDQAVREAVLLDINWQRCDTAVDLPWRNLAGTILPEADAGAGSSNILNVFSETDRALLILGVPGAGKTITLLRLARELIDRAEADERQPIPVILNLASWAEKRAPLADWIIYELTAKYQIPERLGRTWLADDELLLLLDGLDTVADRFRAECVTAVNQFRETHGLTGLVVCSRQEAYESLANRLKMGGAILLQPLTVAQINTYIQAAVSSLPQTAVQDHTALAEIAQSPLMLSVMMRAFNDETAVAPLTENNWTQTLAEAIEEDETLAQLYHHLFAVYVAQMFQRQGNDGAYTEKQTMAWLSWLAKRMSQHNQSTFLIEQIQPSWLPTTRWRYYYLLLSRLTDGFMGGVVLWLLLLLFQQAVPPFQTGLSDFTARLLQWPLALSQFIGMIIFNMLLSLLVALMFGVLFTKYPIKSSDPTSRWRRRGQSLLVGIIIGVVTTLLLVQIVDPLLALSWGTAEGFLFGLVARYSYGSSFRDEIRPVSALSWSWREALKVGIVGLILAFIAEVIETQLYGYNGFARTFLAVGLGGFLLGGLTGETLKKSFRPNQGTWLSLRNSVMAAFIAGALLGLLMGLLYMDVRMGVLTVVFMALLVAPLYGSGNVVKHFLLRGLLWAQRVVPGNYSRFLDSAVNHAFLHKVGGGYIFIHRLLQDFFRTQTVSLK